MDSFRWRLMEAVGNALGAIDVRGLSPGMEGYRPPGGTFVLGRSDTRDPTALFGDGVLPCIYVPAREDCYDKDVISFIEDLTPSPVFGGGAWSTNVQGNPVSRYFDGTDMGPPGNDSGHVEIGLAVQFSTRFSGVDGPKPWLDRAKALYFKLHAVQSMFAAERQKQTCFKTGPFGLGSRSPCVIGVDFGRGSVSTEDRVRGILTDRLWGHLRVALTVSEKFAT